MTLEVPALTDEDLAELLRPTAPNLRYSAPAVLSDESRDEDQAEWVIAGVIVGIAAIVVGVSTAWAFYVCSTCQARSLSACEYDLRVWWTRGC